MSASIHPSGAAAAAPAARQVPCPQCGEPAVFAASNAHRPFCSERCRQYDFGSWASEQFRVAVKPPSPDDLVD